MDGVSDLGKIKGSSVFTSICQYCAVGCSVLVYVRDGKVVNLEGDPESPINRGTLCPKGLYLSQLTHSPRRLIRPLYRGPGEKEWREISWDEALNAIARKIKSTRDEHWDDKRRAANGLAILGSAVIPNEDVYLLTKMARVLGVTYFDHQSRICHAPTVWGLQSTVGYGAMSNTFTDMVHSRCVIIFSNPAECHPVAMRQIIIAKEKGAKVIVVDPRYTRTAAVADQYVKLRSGTDISFVGGIINYLIQNKLYDENYIKEFTNALYLVNENYSFNEGIFHGFDQNTRKYDVKAWKYQLDEEGKPKKASTLESPESVFSTLKKHFSRYTLDMLEKITGIPGETVKNVAESLAHNKPCSLVFAVGSTQHTVGTQIIRSYAILQLLLGNVGQVGGGILAYRGHSNIQGATDLGANYEAVPGYAGLFPSDEEPDLKTWTDKYGENNRNKLIGLLKAWFGAEATESNNWGYNLLPLRKSEVKQSIVNMFKDFGEIKTFMCFGQNPVMSNPNQNVTLKSLTKLQTLVVTDIFETETASFWKAPGMDGSKIETEVFLLPAAGCLEKEGSRTNSSRWIQWGYKAVDPPGEAKSDLWIVNSLFKKIQDLYMESKEEKDNPILKCRWDYGEPPEADKVLKEMNGYHISSGKPLQNGEEAAKASPGEIGVGCWVYAGVFATENKAKYRDNTNVGGVDIYPKWVFSWPDNIRIWGNRGSCDAWGQPLDPDRTLIKWEGDKWGGPDTPDIFMRDSSPTSENGKRSFLLNAENVARLCVLSYEDPKGEKVSRMLDDGPLPEHYEPVESPVENFLHTGVATNPLVPLPEIGQIDKFPYILTTYRLTEHHTGGPSTRNLTWAAEMMPELFIEISESLGKQLRVSSGDVVEVITIRGSITGKALVSPRISPFKIGEKTVELVGVPFHWGFTGLAKGDSANTLTIDALDPTAQMPELKVCLCNVRRK